MFFKVKKNQTIFVYSITLPIKTVNHSSNHLQVKSKQIKLKWNNKEGGKQVWNLAYYLPACKMVRRWLISLLLTNWEIQAYQLSPFLPPKLFLCCIAIPFIGSQSLFTIPLPTFFLRLQCAWMKNIQSPQWLSIWLASFENVR